MRRVPAIRIHLRPHTPGVDRAFWHTDDHPTDMFLIARQATTATANLSTVDVIVLRTEPTPRAADDSGRATLRRLPGCTLVAVGVRDHGCLLRCLGNTALFLPTGDGSAADAHRWAVLAYPTLVLTGTLDPVAAALTR